MPSTTTPSRGTTDSGASLSQETIYDVLSNRRRRYAIHALKRADEEVDVTELSRRITAWEVGVDPEEVEYQDRRRVYSTLKGTHLPMLDDHDLIDYDEETNLVEPAPLLAELDVYVEVLQGKEIPWSLYYVGIASVSVLLLLAVVVDVPGLAAIGPMGVSLFTITAFGISGVAHHYYGERSRLGNEEKPPELRKRE